MGNFDFKVGQHVVCVPAPDSHTGWRLETESGELEDRPDGPECGLVYTVRGIDRLRGILLEELSSQVSYPDGSECGYDARRFKPVTLIETENCTAISTTDLELARYLASKPERDPESPEPAPDLTGLYERLKSTKH